MAERKYVICENKMIYEVSIASQTDSYMVLGLELVCGIDYINPDESDEQGYVPADRFTEDVQYEQVVCYFYEESVKDALAEWGYEPIKGLEITVSNPCRYRITM